jgi:ADP-ribosylglycohydrolase
VSPPLDRERFRGALLGLAVGDAIGAPVESLPPSAFTPLTDMTGGGRHGLPPGAWTDDTSMALCLAESLVEQGRFDPVDQLERYLRWYREGHLSSIGRAFDVGEATLAALERFAAGREPYPGDAAPEAAGNGALMCLAPVPLAFAGAPERAVALAALSARTTHGAPQARDACRYLAALLVAAVHGRPREELLGGVVEVVPGLWEREPLHPEVEAVARGSFRARRPPDVRAAGYAPATLEAALWALHATDGFADAVLAAANLGGDADTAAAVCGQLAGAIHGAAGIPARWRARLVMHDEIVALADGLHRLAARAGAGVAA